MTAITNGKLSYLKIAVRLESYFIVLRSAIADVLNSMFLMIIIMCCRSNQSVYQHTDVINIWQHANQ